MSSIIFFQNIAFKIKESAVKVIYVLTNIYFQILWVYADIV
jgi:hypothetical protein